MYDLEWPLSQIQCHWLINSFGVRPKFGFGFGYGAETDLTYGFGLVSAMAKVHWHKFGFVIRWSAIGFGFGYGYGRKWAISFGRSFGYGHNWTSVPAPLSATAETSFWFRSVSIWRTENAPICVFGWDPISHIEPSARIPHYISNYTQLRKKAELGCRAQNRSAIAKQTEMPTPVVVFIVCLRLGRWQQND